MDANYGTMMKTHFLAIDKKMDKAMYSNRACINISKLLMQDAEILNACDNMLRDTKIKHDIMISQKNDPMIVVKESCEGTMGIVDRENCGVNGKIVRKGKSFKPCIINKPQKLERKNE